MAKSVEVPLEIPAGDSSGVDLVEQLNLRIDRATKAIAAAQKQGSIRAVVAESEVKKVVTLTNEVGDLVKEYEFLTQAMTQVASTDPGFIEMTKRAQQLEDQIRRVSGELQDVPNKLNVSKPASEQFDVGLPDTSLSAISAVSRGLGGNQIADLTGTASDILATVDALSKLAPALTNAPGIIGKVATQGASLAAPLGATAASFAAVFAVVAPAAILLGVVALAVTKYNESLEGSKKALDGALAAQEGYYDALENLTTEEVEKEIARLEKTLPVIQQQRDETAAAIQGVWDAAVAQFGDLGAKALEAAGQLPTGELKKRLGELDAQLQTNIQTTTRYNQGLAINAFAANDAAVAEEDLAAKRQAAITNIQALQDQQTQIQEAFDEQQLQMQQDRHLAETREQEDFWRNRLRATKQNDEAISKIEEQGQDRVAQIHQAGVDKIADIDGQIKKLGDSLSNLGAETTRAIDKINSDFMAQEISDIRQRQAEEEKISKEYNKRRARTLKELANDLLDAEAANDVVAFIARKRAGEEQLHQMAEDHDDEAKERQREFEEERRAAAEARKARIAEALAAADERRADIEAQRQEQIELRDQTLAAIKDQEAAELARIQASKDAAQAAFDDRIKQEDEDRKIRLQREADDNATAEKRRQDALKKQMDDINTKINAERQAAGLVGQAFVGMAGVVATSVVNAINAIRSAAQQASSSSSWMDGGSSGGGSSSNPPPLTAFANEGTVKRPTIALIGERLKPGEVESVFKWKPSEGLDHMADNSVTINAQINVTAQGDVSGEIERGLIAAARGISRARKASG